MQTHYEGRHPSAYNAGEQVTYGYDALNRLLTAKSEVNGNAGWGGTYGYDGFVNLWSKTPSGSAGAPPLSLSIDQTTNRIAGCCDANGNQLSVMVGGTTIGLVYDIENRLVATGNGNRYGYDAQNKWVWQWSGTLDGAGNVNNYLVNFYGVDGKRLGQYQFSNATSVNDDRLTATLVNSEAYFGSRRVAPLDRLGSAGKYYPYGEDKGTGNPPNDNWKFGTYWRDSATHPCASQYAATYIFNRFTFTLLQDFNLLGWFGDPSGWTPGWNKTVPELWRGVAC